MNRYKFERFQIINVALMNMVIINEYLANVHHFKLRNSENISTKNTSHTARNNQINLFQKI